MISERDSIEFEELTTRSRSSDIRKLPVPKKGYDTCILHMPKPKELLSAKKQGIARYASVLPVGEIPFSLGEGETPLTHSKVFANVFIKNEAMNPTGSFKDRESAFALAYAKEQGWKDLAMASSGNAALSGAFYARMYGIRMTCYIPKDTSKAKSQMIELFGGYAHKVGTNYEESYHYLLNHLPSGSVNITSGVFSLRCEGAKTIAYELWEDLGEVPDVVLCPAGNGSALASIYHGFFELRQWGFTDKIPAMVCVQIAGADPINQAFDRGEWIIVLDDVPVSECEAIVAKESFCSAKAVNAMRQSGGFGISVTDDQVIDGLRFAIDREGIFPEFSSASVFAAFLEHTDKIKSLGEKIVLINTGGGLKEIDLINKALQSSGR